MTWHVGRWVLHRFMSEAPEFVKFLLGMYDDLQFFMGKSMNPDGGMVFSYYKDGAACPTFIYIKAGLKIYKVRATATGCVGRCAGDWEG